MIRCKIARYQRINLFDFFHIPAYTSGLTKKLAHRLTKLSPLKVKKS